VALTEAYMIQSAMIFALGFLVCGLVALLFSIALVRRTRRLAEKRLLARISTRRAEFETERDEMRARHAVQMYRLEGQVSKILDMATAHRLEADIKERDIVGLRSELEAHAAEMDELNERLIGQRDTLQDLERRHAEAGAVLRATQHALRLESRRRAAAEELLSDIELPEQKRDARIAALRSEIGQLQATITHLQSFYNHIDLPGAGGVPPAPQPTAEVVPLPTRVRTPPDPAHRVEPLTLPDAPAFDVAIPGIDRPSAWDADLEAEAEPARAKGNPEDRFFEALKQIRALRAGTRQAGE
jgi:hypothetical protein